MWGLFRRRTLLVPTWRGWLLLVGLSGGVLLLCLRELYPFLAVSDPLPGGVLVVEGWSNDASMAAAVAEFNRNHYDKLYVTGGPLEQGAPLSRYKTYAELGAAILVQLGLSTNEVQAVPAPAVRADRTYTSAVALGRWWRGQGLAPAKVHLVSSGPHARRSRLLFVKALGPGVSVGVTALPVQDYDPNRWWRYSAGFRNVTDEAIAYTYARLLFHPAPNAAGE
jgi:uncharacterized SAM-binding protein YcdF (DUF218 family)